MRAEKHKHRENDKKEIGDGADVWSDCQSGSTDSARWLGAQLHRRYEVLEVVSTLGLRRGLSPARSWHPAFTSFNKCKQRSFLLRASPCRSVYTSKQIPWPCHVCISVFPGSPGSRGKGTAQDAGQRCRMLHPRVEKTGTSEVAKGCVISGERQKEQTNGFLTKIELVQELCILVQDNSGPVWYIATGSPKHGTGILSPGLASLG